MVETITPIFTFSNAMKCKTLKDGRKVVHALISKRKRDQLQICSTEGMSYDKDSFEEIGIPQYIGQTSEDVIKAFPELSGITESEEGEIRNFIPNTWTSQKHGEMAGYFVVGYADHDKFKMVVTSIKEIDIEVIKLKPEYIKEKVWFDKLVKDKENERKGFF